jgi:AraC-like DNA-binding protein
MNTDILADVLRTVRLSGAIFFDANASAPWVAEAPPGAVLAPRLLLGAQHVIEYHIVTSGHCWASIIGADSAPLQLAPGSIIVFPHGDAHVLSSAPHMRGSPDMSLYRRPGDGELLPFYLEQRGGGTDHTRLICGFLGCDVSPFNPLIQALPKLLHIADGYNSGDGWLGSLINATRKESSDKRVGSGSVLAKLSELIFIEVVRRYIESLPPEASGWLAALTDPHIGRAIKLLHDQPQRAWNLAELAHAVGMSRTVLVERFTSYTGVPPMTYLLNWRMQIAAGMLAEGTSTIARIAADIGYMSEAAFSRAFKRSAGQAPAAWRENIARTMPNRQAGANSLRTDDIYSEAPKRAPSRIA